MTRVSGGIAVSCLIAASIVGLLLIPFGSAPEHVIDGVASTVVGWTWPGVLLGLVVFVWLRSRRHPSSRTRRWVLYPVLFVLTLTALGGTYETVAEARDARAHSFPGRLIEVHGRRLHLDCRGDHGPTVVLISGFGEISSDWAWIAEDVSRDVRVCAYDPAGRAWSDAAEAPQDGVARARDLYDLLRTAGESGPYVLVGHSFGGLYARIFAAHYPDDVAGMVLLDATSPDMFSLPSYARIYGVYRRASALFPSLARLGVGRMLFASTRAGLPSPARERVRAVSSTTRSFREQRDEWAEAPTAMAQARALTTLGDRPLVVVTAARGAQAGWLPLQGALTELSANVQQRILAEADHSGLLEDQDQAKRSSAAIREVVVAIRRDTPLGMVSPFVQVPGASSADLLLVASRSPSRGGSK